MEANTVKRKRIREQKRNGAPMTVRGMEKFVKAELTQEAKKVEALVVRPVGRPPGRTAFQSVMKAREILAQSSVMAARLIAKAAKVAASKGDSAPAEFLLKHVGANDDKGKLTRPLQTSVDKLEGEGGSRAPTINIGWIGGPGAPREALPAVSVIDVLALPPHESDS